jgi:glycine hydroxymethyltransferase
VAKEERSPFQTSGIRLGTPALTTRGLKEADLRDVAAIIDRVLKSKGDEGVIEQVRQDVRDLCAKFPMPH